MAISRLSTPFAEGAIAVPESGQIAILRATPSSDYSAFPKDRVVAFQSFKPLHDRLEQEGFVVGETLSQICAQTLVQVTRSKAESLGLIALALQQTEIGGLVLVDGAKTEGIDSILKRCKQVMPIEGVLSKSHGKVFWIRREAVVPDALAEWLSALVPAQNKAGFMTAPGMFSPDKIDHGSALLAQHFEGALSGQVADLGAGWGWLAAQALKQDAITGLDLYEAERTALDAARANITDPRARFIWEDVAKISAPKAYDMVICNPPFHQTRAAEPALGLAFIAKAAEILKPSGKLWLVANRQLPYEDALGRAFTKWVYLEDTPHFKVIQATRPKSASARNIARNPVKSR